VSATPPPPLSRQDRAAAGARGVAARQARAALRAGLRDGSLGIADVLSAGQRGDDDSRVVARMRVVDLLESFRGIGPVRAGDIMQRVGIAPNRRVGGLGRHQVDGLVAVLAERGGAGS